MRATTVSIDRSGEAGEIADPFAVGCASELLWRTEGITLAGIGEAARIDLARPAGFADAMARLAALAPGDGIETEPPGRGPVAFTALGFDREEPGNLIVPEVVIGSDRTAGNEACWVTCIDAGPSDEASVLARAKERVDAVLAEDSERSGRPQPNTLNVHATLSPETWRDEVVTPARQAIRDGRLNKAVLARELVINSDQPIALASVLRRLAGTFPTAQVFAIDGFVGASPEQLVSRIGSEVRAHPLAGTAPRSSDPKLDAATAENLFASTKDRWEHRITIDWLLDTLLPFCSYVDAEPQPSIVTLANVHHLGTRVEGKLSSPAASALELVAALHPTPAVGGAPQADALALIAELERADRGRYAGPAGWVDANGNGVFAVSVRTAQFAAGGDPLAIRLFAGVGVVEDSDPEAELAETRAKFSAMLGALLSP